jgi:sugar O-acyltransferase (sialic acid O-acetyltransferase NeuD family)
VWGASGHALVVADLLRQADREVCCFIDGVNAERDGEAFGGAVVRSERAVEEAWAKGVREAVVAVGDNARRVEIADELEARGFRLPSLAHPRAVIAEGATLGAGAVLCANAVVGAGASIGDYGIVNTAATVDHECTLGKGVHVSPGAHLGGGVRVGAGAWIGIGTVVRERVRIGAGSLIGAGAVVVSDIPDGVVAYGVPARVIREVG